MSKISTTCPKCGHDMQLKHQPINANGIDSLIIPEITKFLVEKKFPDFIIRQCNECNYTDSIEPLDRPKDKI